MNLRSLPEAMRGRWLLALLALILAPLAGLAQYPQYMSYQGYLTDGSGNVLGSTNTGPKAYDVVFRLWDLPTGGTVGSADELFAELQTVTVDNGYFNVLLGSGTAYQTEPHNALSGAFTSLSTPRFVEMTVLGIAANGASVTILPRLQLVYSPYSLLSVNAMNVTGSNVISPNNLGTNIGLWQTAGQNIFYSSGRVGIGTGTPSSSLEVAGNGQIDGSATINAGATITGGAIINGGGTINGATTVNGSAIIATNATIGGNATINGNAAVGSATIGTNVTVGANATINGYVNFANTLGDKAVLWGTPGSASYGFGIAPSTLQIHTINTASDIAFGAGSSTSFTELMRIKGDGNIGINTSAPGFPLVVAASAPYNQASGGYWYEDIYGTGVPGSFGAPISIWAQQGIVSQYGFFLLSDSRIKKDLLRSDAGADLEKLGRLKVTDFAYIDTIKYGPRRKKGLIAQEVEEVFPEAVTHQTGVVPDIYKRAQCHDGWIELATDLKKGDRVQLITHKGEGIYEVLEVTKDKFLTDLKPDDDKVFVFGREVKDLHTVDYNLITALNVSATQELASRETKLEERESELEQKAARLEALEREMAELQKTVAQLASPTKGAHVAAQEIPSADAHGSLLATRLEQ